MVRRMTRIEPEAMPQFFAREMTHRPPEQVIEVLRRVAAKMASSNNKRMAEISTVVAATAELFSILRKSAPDPSCRDELAEALMTHRESLLQLAERQAQRPKTRRASEISYYLASQEKLCASLLRAESLTQVFALRPEMDELARRASETSLRPLLDRDLTVDLENITNVVEQFGRLPDPEDRALYLGKALSQTLSAIDRLQAAPRNSPPKQLDRAVLVCFRELLAKALQDIKHRATLKVTLHSKTLTAQREAVVVLEVQNVGQGHARNILVELCPGTEFEAFNRRGGIKSLRRHQSARLEFLVEPRVSDRVRLDFRITYDDLDRQGQEREFADVVEFRQAPRYQTFRPLRPNPYVIGRPLLESDVFIGRDALFDRLLRSLRRTSQDVLVLVGARRMGKTSILRRLRLYLGEDYAPILVDLQGLISAGDAAFFRELTSTIQDGLEELGIDVSEPPPEAFEPNPGETFRHRFLQDVQAALGPRRLLLLFDEFEVFEARIRSGDLSLRILPYLRELLRHNPNIRFIFSGTHHFDELTYDYWETLSQNAVYFHVDHLPENDVKLLFTQPTEDFFELDALALDKAWQLTGGHPHFSQLLARELVDFRNESQLSYVTVQEMNLVADQVAEKGQLHISYLWEQAIRDQRFLLLTLKELLDRKGLATLSAAQRYLEEYAIETHDLTADLQRLVERGILVDNAGLVSFRMELLRLWLDRHHDLESFLMSEGPGGGD